MLEWDRRKIIFTAVALVALSFATGFFLGGRRESRQQEVAALMQSLQTTPVLLEETKPLVVYVSGAVVKPGVYELPMDSRMHQAIAMAEPKEDANLDVLGMARLLEDGESIYVPSHIETETPGENINWQQMTSVADGKVNINQATAAELLAKLPGIGEVIAQRIVDYRNANGKFSSIEEIKNVSGIGEKKYEAIAPLIKVR